MDYYLEKGGMQLNDAVGENCKKVQLLKIKAQVPSIYKQRGVCFIIVPA